MMDYCDGCANNGRQPTTPVTFYQWLCPGGPIYELCEECADSVSRQVLRIEDALPREDA